MAVTREQERALALAAARRRAATASAPAMTQAEFDDRFSAATGPTPPPAQPQASGGGLPSIVQRADDAVRLLASGATFGFADKLAGFLGGQGTDAERSRTQAARERTGPIASPVLEFGGAVAPFAALPRAAAAVPAGVQGLRGLLARTGLSAAEGAGYGTLAAVGHDTDIGQGAAIGALFGGAAEPVASGVGALGGSVMGAVRGLVSPGREAARRVAYARAVDDTIPQARVGAVEEATATRAGQPILNIDRGGETTRELARSAANTSSLAWSTLDSTLRNRTQGQVPRVVDVIRRLVGGNSSMANRDLLRRMARQQNTPAYRRAMSDPAGQSVWDNTLLELTGAPVVQDAIRKAAIRGRNVAAQEGVPPIRSPFRMDPQTGRMSPIAGVTPNLRFWDEVKKALDDVGTRDARDFARTLRTHLDTIVPSYQTARAGAARFFGAEDALEAGEQFASSSLRLGSDEAAAAIQRFSRAERQLFREGFADALVKRVMATGDNRNIVINSIFNSPAARERIVLALGPQRARELEAVLRVEELMEMARQAMGNSSTARQLIAQGIVGGTAGGALTGDWVGVSGGVLASMLLRRGLQSVNQDVATRVAQMLTSPDPAVAQRGIAMLARSEALMDALRAATLAGGVSMVAARAN